ncbi:MAG: protein phosphatase 2C domain-containing protein [Acetobacteraceae bacterium]|nr:protein phosphatase 2C domain-containing protein [Acetobacteraceae bacterium]
MQAWAATDAGRVRKSNEDCYFAGELGSGTGAYFFAVADGMGGHEGGEVASRLAVGAAVAWLRRWAQAGPDAPSPGAALSEAVLAANRALLAAGRARPERVEMGTTFTAALVVGGRAWLGHVGDSRAYVLRRGSLRCLTQDHSLAAELARTGSLCPEEVRGHPLRSLLTRSLGAAEEVEPDFFQVELSSGDVLLLCTDGLTSVVAEDELAGEALACAHPRELPARLVRLANLRGGPDNVTVVVGWAGGEGEV